MIYEGKEVKYVWRVWNTEKKEMESIDSKGKLISFIPGFSEEDPICWALIKNSLGKVDAVHYDQITILDEAIQ